MKDFKGGMGRAKSSLDRPWNPGTMKGRFDSIVTGPGWTVPLLFDNPGRTNLMRLSEIRPYNFGFLHRPRTSFVFCPLVFISHYNRETHSLRARSPLLNARVEGRPTSDAFLRWAHDRDMGAVVRKGQAPQGRYAPLLKLQARVAGLRSSTHAALQGCLNVVYREKFLIRKFQNFKNWKFDR